MKGTFINNFQREVESYPNDGGIPQYTESKTKNKTEEGEDIRKEITAGFIVECLQSQGIESEQANDLAAFIYGSWVLKNKSLSSLTSKEIVTNVDGEEYYKPLHEFLLHKYGLLCTYPEVVKVLDLLTTTENIVPEEIVTGREEETCDCPMCEFCRNKKAFSNIEEKNTSVIEGKIKYYHDIHCSASPYEPMGNEGCSCSMYQRAKLAESQLKITPSEPSTIPVVDYKKEERTLENKFVELIHDCKPFSETVEGCVKIAKEYAASQIFSPSEEIAEILFW